MQMKEAIFLTSSPGYQQCPSGDKPEICFIGRSNVGKSSLINMLVGKKQLAKTSATPGKTQLINHYLINQSHYWVDLPGYGWAQASKQKRQNWFTMINQYLLYRPNLTCLFVLLDIRLPPQAIDLDFTEWLHNHRIPFAILLTKADKIAKKQVVNQFQTFQQTWADKGLNPLTYLITSAKNQQGKELVLHWINRLCLVEK